MSGGWETRRGNMWRLAAVFAAAATLASLFPHIFDGDNESVAQGVADVLGRPATDFTVFAAEAAATGAWSRESAEGATR